jgi:hypothetical protein
MTLISVPLLIVEMIRALVGVSSHQTSHSTGCATFACSAQNVASNSSAWRFGRILSPDQKDTFVSITKTANTLQSDPDFAGLMLRCSKGKVDILVVLIRPLAPKARPTVTIESDNASPAMFEGAIATAGAAVTLPEAASVLPGGQWRGLQSLSITVKDGHDAIKGQVDLDGLAPAYSNLMTSCG